MKYLVLLFPIPDLYFSFWLEYALAAFVASSVILALLCCAVFVLGIYILKVVSVPVTFKQLRNLFPCQPLCLISSHFTPTLFKDT